MAEAEDIACGKNNCGEPPEWYLTVESVYPGWYTCSIHLNEAIQAIRENIPYSVHVRIINLND